MWVSGIGLTQGRGRVEGASGRVRNGYSVGNVLLRRKGVRGLSQGCIRCKLAWDGAKGFRFGIGCSGMVLMTWDGRRQVEIG